MKRHFKCGEKPFQKRVEDMVKNLEALFKQDDSPTTKKNHIWCRFLDCHWSHFDLCRVLVCKLVL